MLKVRLESQTFQLTSYVVFTTEDWILYFVKDFGIGRMLK